MSVAYADILDTTSDPYEQCNIWSMEPKRTFRVKCGFDIPDASFKNRHYPVILVGCEVSPFVDRARGGYDLCECGKMFSYCSILHAKSS